MRPIQAATEQFEAHSYPTTTESLIDAYGEEVIEHPNGTETLGDVLGLLGPTTYESAAEARTAALSAVGSEAIGRKGYSDRDPTAPGEDGPDQVSF